MMIQASEAYAMCFGCGRDNPAGLHLRFPQEGEVAAPSSCPTSDIRAGKGSCMAGS